MNEHGPRSQRFRASTPTDLFSGLLVVNALAVGVSALLWLLIGEGPLALRGVVAAGLFILGLGASLLGWRTYRDSAEASAALPAASLAGSSAATQAATRDILRERLNSERLSEAHYALERLSNDAPPDFDDLLIALLDHPQATLRLGALERLETRLVSAALPRINQLTTNDPDQQVRERAYRALAVLAEGDTKQVVRAIINDIGTFTPDLLAGMLLSGSLDNIIYAGPRVKTMAESPDPARRALAADILARAGVETYYRPLLSLLNDEDGAVRRMALHAAGRIRHPRFWPLVIAQVSDPQTAGQAVSALFRADERVYAAMREAFNQGHLARKQALKLVRVSTRRRDPGAGHLLLDLRTHPDPVLRDAVLAGLVRLGYHAQDATERATLRAANQADVARIGTLLYSLDDLKDLRIMVLYLVTVQCEVRRLRARLFQRLALLYDPQGMRTIQRQLDSDTVERRSEALRSLDRALEEPDRALLRPIFQDAVQEGRIDQLTPFDHETNRPMQERLHEVLGWRHPVLSATVAYIIGREGMGDFLLDLSDLRDDENRLLAQTARWALERLHPDESATKDTTTMEPETNLLLIERILLLKNIPVFADTADYVLEEVAAQMHEVFLSEGTVLFERGDAGASLYVIYSGHIRLMANGQTVADLRDYEIMGEMALLDHEPRSTRALAVQDTTLLELDQPIFQDLIADHPEILHGIVKVLTARLRTTLRPDRGDVLTLRTAEAE